MLHGHLFQRLESDDNSVPPDSHEFHCQGGRGNVRQPHNEQPAEKLAYSRGIIIKQHLYQPSCIIVGLPYELGMD